MSWSSISRLAWSVVFTVSVVVSAKTSLAAEPNPHMKLTVSVYDHAHVPPGTLIKSKKAAAQIFRQAGLEVVWFDSPLSAEEAKPDPNYQKRHLGLADFVLKILPDSMTQHLKIRD